jgi:hypothetical protein
MDLIDIHNQRFGKLIVLSREDKKWKCLCDCGKFCFSTGAHLRQGRMKSCGCKKSLPHGEASLNNLYSSYKYRAENVIEVPFQLTMDEFRLLTSKNCYYCNVPPLQEAKGSPRKRKKNKNREPRIQKYNGIYLYNGIDRIDSSKGYTIDSVRTCCGICNKAKRDLKEEDFKLWILRLISYQLSLSPSQNQ